MVKRYRLIKNFNRKCDADVNVHLHVNGEDRGDYNSRRAKNDLSSKKWCLFLLVPFPDYCLVFEYLSYIPVTLKI